MEDRRAVKQASGVSDFSRVLRPIRARPADTVRPTRAEIDLSALRHNFAVLQKKSLSPVWPVIKADAYGHGAKGIARTLERAGAQGFCVALVEEAVELREAGVFASVLVMGGHYDRAYEELLRHSITPVLTSAAQIESLSCAARQHQTAPVAVHLKIDTGMGRLGVVPRDLEDVADAFQRNPQIQLQGLMTHFACADTDPDSVRRQLEVFSAATKTLAARGLNATCRHAANTAALLGAPESHFEMTRPGIGLFGVAPTPGYGEELRPVMRVRTAVVAMRELQVGETVGYGARWTAQRTSQIATIPMGYADGFSRMLSEKGSVLVNGHRCPVAGTVSMDMASIDVTDVPTRIGDEVIVLGSQRGLAGERTITARDIADITSSIPWEVLTSISRRVPRFYREP